MPEALHLCHSSPCPYCGSSFKDPPFYPDREKKKAKQATEQREQRKLRERTQIRAGSRTLGLEEEQLQSSKHTAATALGLSLQCSNFSKDQNGPDTPLERGESSTSPWRGSSERHDQGKHVAEIRPPYPLWRKEKIKIGLGSYPTKEAAARAFDVGIYYTSKSVPFNISSPAAFLPLFPANLSFDKLEDVRAIREFVRKEAQNFVAMNEKAKAPSQQVSSLLEKDGDMSLEGIVSPPSSMGSKLPMEDDNVDKLEDVRAIREFVRKEAQDFVAMNEKAKAPSQQVSSLLEKDGDMSLKGIVSPPSSMGSKLPMEDDNFDKLEDVRAIREFVQKEAQDFVAMNEKAKAPYQQVSSLLEKDGDMSLEGIVSPRSSMGSKLPMEDDNGEPLQENYELLTTATPFFSWEWPLRNEAQVSASEEDPWLESFLNSLSDLNQNCMNEEGQFMIPESIHVTLCVILPTMAENELGYG